MLIPFALLAVVVLLFVTEKPLATTVDNSSAAPAGESPDATEHRAAAPPQ